jgi:ADP-ribosyl-[dinitrogen reductase] hydrolase
MNQMDDREQEPPTGAGMAPVSGVLAVADVPFPGGAVVGIVPCPGRNQVDGIGRRWRRDLGADLAALEAWGASAVVSLVEAHEFPHLGVPEFEHRMREQNMAWYHLPITDMEPPGPAFEMAWRAYGANILGRLQRAERIIIHCAGGLGRSGTIAAKLLIAFGVEPAEAIVSVRAARLGAIETRAQEEYVLGGPSLGKMPA